MRSDSSQFKKIFYVLYIDNEIGKCIDAIRFIASPKEKHASHVTVRGPYKRRISVKKINSKLKGNIIRISGVGSFISRVNNQTTVFFKCDGTHLRNVWGKREFGYEPHITVYDGEDFDFAEELYRLMNQFYFDLTFYSDQLEVLSTLPRQTSFGPKLVFKDDFIRGILCDPGLTPDLEKLDDLTSRKKIFLIKKICKYLSFRSSKFPIPKAMSFN
jgi:hypothetical protein